MIYVAIGFPPAAKSSAYRMRETANQFCQQGWDVTVVTISRQAWERETGIDLSLSESVDQRIRTVELPLVREDLETNIRNYSAARAMRPLRWIEKLRERELRAFPEPVFGGWRSTLEQAVLNVHRRHPADLVMVTCKPYVGLAAAWHLWQRCHVPYAVDFRDGWSVDVLGESEAFPLESKAGQWESKVLEKAISFWCVNEPIASFYRGRYKHLAARVQVVRNGYDRDSIPPHTGRSNRSAGLTFGYLGTVSFSPAQLEVVLDAWRLARSRDPLIARSTLEFRGHIGIGAQREANAQMELLRAASIDGVTFEGPVAKADVAVVYSTWDALVLVLPGSRYMTSGKVYEYMATGLPIVSAHRDVHDATTILNGYPLWAGPAGVASGDLAEAFCRAAKLAVVSTNADRLIARAHAESYERGALLEPAVAHITGLLHSSDSRTGDYVHG